MGYVFFENQTKTHRVTKSELKSFCQLSPKNHTPVTMTFPIRMLRVCILGMGLLSNAEKECSGDESAMLQTKMHEVNAAQEAILPSEEVDDDGVVTIHTDEGDFEDWELADEGDEDQPDPDDPVGSSDLLLVGEGAARRRRGEEPGQRRRCCGNRRRSCGKCHGRGYRRRRQCDCKSSGNCKTDDPGEQCTTDERPDAFDLDR